MIALKLLLVFFFIAFLGISLTGQQLSAYCYCDITENFCDFNCCCDSSCSSSTDNACLSDTSEFCIQQAFYYSINPTNAQQDTTNTNCYKYTEESSIQEEVVPSSKQIISYIKKASKIIPITNNGMYQGYQPNIAFTVGSFSSFQFVQSDGTCLSSSSSMANNHFNLKFKNNIRISCTSSTNSIKMFSSFLGQRVYRYYLHNNNTQSITIPSEMPAGHNQLYVYFIIGIYGSQKVFYIRDVQIKTAQNTDNSSKRTLFIKYINPYTDYKQEDPTPSFFPQIPYDIFYPIQQFVYSF